MHRLEQAELALQESAILEILSAYSPTVVSTLWVGLDIPGSDIDIICQYKEPNRFSADVIDCCQQLPEFTIQKNESTVVARCQLQAFPLEIFGSPKPIKEQSAYLHFQVMQRLVALASEEFRMQVRCLKREGVKTEPAIAKLMQLSGDPYQAVASLRHLSDDDLSQRLRLLDFVEIPNQLDGHVE